MQNKKALLIVIGVIILVLIAFAICKLNAKDYNKISETFYENVLEDYLSNEQDNVIIASKNFINLSSQEQLSSDLIDNIMTNVKYKNVKISDNQEIKPEQKNISIEFVNYNIKEIKFSIYTYYGNTLKEINNYSGKYTRNNWNLKIEGTAFID